jgi:PAS domain S-box-containing protein
VAGAGVDITDLTQARDALNAQALRYKTLMATSTDSIYILDQNGDLQEANAAFLRRRGYTPAEVKGLNVADWDAQWNREEIRERIQDVLESSAMFETRHRCKDGSIFDVEVCATGVQIAGEQLFFCVTRDISERKQAEDRLRRSEEKFKTLFGLAPVGISVVDQQHNVVDANPALEQIVRLSRKELMSRKHPHRVILSADGKPKLLHEFPSQRAIKENRAIHDEMAIVAENGEIIWVQVSAAPLALPDASAVVITQDITERKRAAKELEEANQQLRTLSRQLFHVQEEERRHLARELHDEIGQNLTAAKINLNIIAPNVPADATRRLEDSIQLLDGLLGQVRQLSLDLRPPLLDELGLVPTLRWLVDQQAQRAGLRGSFTANVDGAEIDPDTRTACFRVAQEAITNIIRHAGAKNVALEVLCDAERLTLSVRDDGAGFNPIAIQQRTTRDFTLGLVSMRERTSLMRGGFEVHSAPGQGTEIRAWFPLAPGKPPSTETA